MQKVFAAILLSAIAAGVSIPVFLLCADATPAQSQSSQSGQLSGEDIISHLNVLIAWYRDLTMNLQPTGLPTDTVYRENAQSLAADAVRLGFQSAREEAQLVSPADKSSGSENPPASNLNAIPNIARVQEHVAALQKQIAQLNQQIASATSRNKKALTAQRDSLQGQLELSQAVLNAVQQLVDFSENTGSGTGTGLLSNINRLGQSIPDVLGKPQAQGGAPGQGTAPGQSSAPATAARTAPTKAPSNDIAASGGGLAAQAFALYSVVKALHQIDLLANETDNVKAAASQVRKPLRDALRAIAQQGGLASTLPSSGGEAASSSAAAATASAAAAAIDKLTGRTGSQSTQPAAQPATQAAPKAAPAAPAPPAVPSVDYAALTQQFNELSSAALPLSQEVLLLEQSKNNLYEWRRTIVRESATSFRALSFHIALIVGALALVLILSEVWRRFTFRYIKDARRRRQFLVVRRFVIGFLMGVILILGFVSQFSSLVTFAGFVTAGIAVGLQAVLLSVAAYFFLIGRWGIRVGDRVSVSGVTGDVIDVGLVRFYMIELGGTGIDLYQTGRIVVFANSVLFQSATPLFKQIPGTEYSWHEVVVPLAPGANYQAVRDWLTNTVNSVYTRYRGEIERQLDSIEERIDMRLMVPAAEGRLHFTDGGLEFAVRYPVEIRRSAEIDEEITRTVLETMEKDASLKTSVPGLPRIRAAVRG